MTRLGRTVTLMVWLSLVMLAALLILSGRPGGESMFGTACFLLGTLAGAQASKSGLEAVATGQGLKGVGATLAGAQKPPAPPPQEPQP